MAPPEPLRLTVLNRFEVILNAMTAGDDFNYAPHLVSQNPISFELAIYGPLYSILTGDEVGPVDQTVGHLTQDETFYVDIHGGVHDETNITAKLENAIDDIRKAINDDALSGDTGTLGQLTMQVRMDESPTVDYYSKEEENYFATFKQKWRVHITGTYR